jgi:hypothetical protein
MPEPERPLMVLVAGPYRSGTGDDPALIARNMQAMDEAALAVFRAGHLPMAGEWFALPLIRTAGPFTMGDATWDAIFHPIAERVATRCDACLRIGGASAGADAMVAIFERADRPVFRRVEELPLVAEGAA